MARLEDNDNPYWCSGWNRGCVFTVRDGWLWRLKILDENNRPLPPEQHQLMERLEPKPGQPDSEPLPPASFFEERHKRRRSARRRRKL